MSVPSALKSIHSWTALSCQRLTISWEILELAVGLDKKQIEEKEYIQGLASVEEHVVLDDMILVDHSKTPVIEVDPNDTILPSLPDPSEVIPGLSRRKKTSRGKGEASSTEAK